MMGHDESSLSSQEGFDRGVVMPLVMAFYSITVWSRVDTADT